MILEWLFHAFHRENLRQNFPEEARIIEQEEGLPGPALGEHFCQFVAHPLRTDLMNLRRQLPNCRQRRRIDGIPETRGEPNGTQHSQLVLCKAQFWIADRTDEARLE